MSPTSMPAVLAAAAQGDPHAPSLTVDERTLTRSELLARAVAFAREYGEIGVDCGDIVSIPMPNGHDFIAAAIAALMLGATPQPLSGRMAPAELEAILGLTRPAVVAIEDEDDRAFDFPVLRRGTVPDGESDAPVPAALLEAVAPSWKAPTSGGSTGRPKVIVSTQTSEFDPDDGLVFTLTHLPEDSAVVVPGPLYHNAPFSWSLRALLRRNHLVLSTRFDAARTLAQIERHRASYMYAVPTMLLRISRLPADERDRFDLSSLATVQHLAAPCPAWLKEEWMDWLGDEAIYELYGGTEGIAYTVISGPEWREHRGSVGRVVAGEMKIVREDGTDAETGEVGDVYLRRDPQATPTYRYLGAESKEIDGGWETLGDIGRVDADGYLYLVDRRSDLILRGGANIYPAEVEAAIEQHPSVLEAVVIGLPDEDLGQRVHAIVRSDEDLDLDRLNTHLAARISKYKLPSSVEVVSEVLRDDSGKVRRSTLRDARP